METNDNTGDQATDVQAVLPAGCPEPEKLNRVASYIEKSVQTISITTPAEYAIAADELQELVGKLDKMTESRMTITRPLDSAKKAVMDLFRSPTERCEAAIKLLKESMLTFSKEETKRKADEQRQEQEKARLARVAAEQAQIAAGAEKERIARDAMNARRAAVDAEQAALEAAASGDTKAEEAASQIALEAQQEVARLASEESAADERVQLQQQSLRVMGAGLSSGGGRSSKIKGISTSAPWTAELENDSDATKMKILQYVLENPAYINFIDINMKPIIQQAKSMQENCIIPGVRVFQQDKMTARRK